MRIFFPPHLLGVTGADLTVRKLRVAKERIRLPEWFRTKLPTGDMLQAYNETKLTVSDNMLHTVCQEARCPNIHECWSEKDATFMVAGQECTRACRFCAVGTIKTPPPLDPNEPENLAEAIEKMGLKHAVITVVNRDDLPDSGASHYKACLQAIRTRCPDVTLELLCSDLAGDFESLALLLEGLELEVFAHNVECVPRLDKAVRDPRASFATSLSILEEAKRLRPDILTKSSLMVGLGEENFEIRESMKLLRSVDVDLLTIGQYLAPSQKHHPVLGFPEPIEFEEWGKEAISLGFLGEACGPLVRSSYRAGRLYRQASARLTSETE